ncbi:MAG: aminotransferase class I/II-fold pyridoxal phosphate-dependent enzyme, partial [Chitinispirillaceae bacterium]|nr:aminotransferase class I/II-fold pyridoxal phosphate-dependent enzyme [Chitinispirillaceae bacterium]
SIYDGIRLAGCKLIRYKHCDMVDLREKIKSSNATEKIIITDTIFSMDGDKAPLCDIAEIASKYKALVIVDEAHATGIFGKNASGVVEESGTGEIIQIRIGTLSKAIAGMGGYVATLNLFRDYFVNFSRSLIFSTALPHSVLAHNLAAIRYIRHHPELGKTLLSTAEDMRQKLEKIGFSTKPSISQIIPIYTKDAQEALSLSSYLRTKKIVVPAIRPPAVPTPRLRLSWNLLLTEEDGDKIIFYLTKWKNGERT